MDFVKDGMTMRKIIMFRVRTMLIIIFLPSTEPTISFSRMILGINVSLAR